ERLRRAVARLLQLAQRHQARRLVLAGGADGFSPEALEAVVESLLLTAYQFTPYFKETPPFSLEEVEILSPDSPARELALQRGQSRAEATIVARDLVNEPPNVLTATELSRRAEQLGAQYGFAVEVLRKPRIQSLKMGGLLAVNAGSLEPPTFTIMEYAAPGHEQDAPLVLVGKGVVFDTGGLSLKPTANSMDFMKADMGGAAAVIGAMCGIAAEGLPGRVIGLVPATDNRPGVRAYAPGDVIRMYDGSTVEVLNTDAEGRMILADALAYAKQYQPRLVIDLATLTGAAVVAIGSPGIAMMRTAPDADRDRLLAAGEAVYERCVELPLWDEYRDMLKSDIADLKNIGGSEAGAITAGKFLEHFTDYPWIHLDIAAPSWRKSPDSYRSKNGTGVGVRLLIDFAARMWAAPAS
ncbi:MAG: leucyl aminopeptidase, partial [Bacteroidetes bacterium]